MSSPTTTSYLPYHEPPILTILIQSSLLLLLNTVNHILDNLIFCGLIGQIFIGVAYGTPGGNILSSESQHVIVQLGYLGLILLVYEGKSFPFSFLVVIANIKKVAFKLNSRL